MIVANTAGITDQLIGSAPAAGAVIIVVSLFIRYLRERDKADSKADTERTKATQAMADSCHTVQAEGHTVMRETAAAMGEVKGALQRLNGG